MKACKGFDKNLRCRGFQYEVGGEYTEETAELCNCGPHACENPLDTLRYYRPGDSRYCEVEIEDNGQRSSYDSKVCGKHIKIGAEIGLKGVINAGVRFVMERCEDATEKYASGVSGNAAASGWSGNAARGARHRRKVISALPLRGVRIAAHAERPGHGSWYPSMAMTGTSSMPQWPKLTAKPSSQTHGTRFVGARS